MAADLSTSFRIGAGGKIVLERIDLITDGAVSELTGVVDSARWPEMLYQVKSKVQFPRMREIFFPRDTFALHGEGEFTGTFHLFKGGRELTGNFFSREAGLNAYRFQHLEGSLAWLPDRFEVSRATSAFFGGRTEFNYLMAPLGKKDEKPHARFEVAYKDIDLEAFTTSMRCRAFALPAAPAGRNLLDWELGRFRRPRPAAGRSR